MQSNAGPVCVIAVPCYNEGARLKSDRFLDFVRELDNIRFLFVNDGSRDNTLDILLRMQSSFPQRIHVLDRKQNSGKAEAVCAGNACSP
jgi:glycosyltransferase involved in cell wall biosynthesis